MNIATAKQNLAVQLDLFGSPAIPRNGQRKTSFVDPAFAENKKLPIHRWVPWIAGFSSKFVEGALRRYLKKKGIVLDPFAGVGTTLVEAALAGHDVIGFEINPYAALACRTKLNAFEIDANKLLETVSRFNTFYKEKMANNYCPRSKAPFGFKTRGVFYSQKVLRKVLILQDFMATLRNDDVRDCFRLAFASTMVSYSNYSYEPSLGQRKSAGKKDVEENPLAKTNP